MLEAIKVFYRQLEDLETPQFDGIENARLRSEARRSSGELIAAGYRSIYEQYLAEGEGFTAGGVKEGEGSDLNDAGEEKEMRTRLTTGMYVLPMERLTVGR